MIQEQANLMWNSMDEEVKTTYGRTYFDTKVLSQPSISKTYWLVINKTPRRLKIIFITEYQFSHTGINTW
jgi:hypothetical protein